MVGADEFPSEDDRSHDSAQPPERLHELSRSQAEARLEEATQRAINRIDQLSEPTLKYFKYDHLPKPLAEVSRPFSLLAHIVVCKLPIGPQRAVALQKLLEAKDAAVRASL